MQNDRQGLELTTASAASASSFDHALEGFIGFRADMAGRTTAALAADPDFVMAHVLQASLAMTAFKSAWLPAVRETVATLQRLAPTATRREQAHIAALATWLDHGPDPATRIWREILDDHPHDMLAFRLAHFAHFWSGRPKAMRADVEAIWPAWTQDRPGYPALLACRSFALEECGDYAEAEACGREAVARDPTEAWGAHAVAHVMEMQGRTAEGVAWLENLAPNWTGIANIQHHLWWHCALFHLERGEVERVLALYDQKIRNLASPLTQALPDLYIDVQNAVSLLFRLELIGADVGHRWEELAPWAAGRIGDTLSGFSIPHWMLALAATGRSAEMAAMLDTLEADPNPIIRTIALPVARAVERRAFGDHRAALDAMRPVLDLMHRLGGSHAQQELLELLFLDCATKAKSAPDHALALQRACNGRSVPPEARLLQ